MTSRWTPTKLDRFIAKRKSGWSCDARVINARFARDEIINLTARRFARNCLSELMPSVDTSVHACIRSLYRTFNIKSAWVIKFRSSSSYCNLIQRICITSDHMNKAYSKLPMIASISILQKCVATTAYEREISSDLRKINFYCLNGITLRIMKMFAFLTALFSPKKKKRLPCLNFIYSKGKHNYRQGQTLRLSLGFFIK